MSDTLGHMGPMYRKRGLDTDAQVIGSRIAAAQAAYDEMDADELAPLVRVALGRAVAGDLDGLVEEVKKVDLTFDVDAGGPELILMATAILREAIEEGGLSDQAALATVVASFGGLRTFEADPDLVGAAQQALVSQQDVGLPLVSPIKWTKRPSLEEEHASLLASTQQNNLSAAHTSLKKILDSAPTYTERAYSALTQQLNVLTSAHNRLVEQMNAHWWVTNGWSLDAGRAFSDMSASEAVLRAAVELARLTQHSSQGLFAAPALLSRLLTQAGFNSKERIRLGDAVKASSIEWRRAWASNWSITGASAPLLPVTLAVAIAVEANDESDWEPRFERAAGVVAGAEMELLGLAHQVYLESLLRPHISA